MNKLEQVLATLNRPCKVVKVVKAPQVWRAQLEPLHSKRVNGSDGILTRPRHLMNYLDAIEVGLGISGVRVVVEDGRLWIEVPREEREFLHWREVEGEGRVPWVLGRDVFGNDLCLDLADAGSPHLLIAGTTGSGKTVALKAGLARLLTKCPRVSVHLIDTKLELQVFRDAPQVQTCVNEVGAAVRVLEAILDSANRRYAGGTGPEPRTVVVVDEFADLVIGNKEMELVMVRLAQKVRAAGTHIVLATQRPSVDVVTGLIRANFPARVVFRTARATDSRVALEMNGAEGLLGKGDGLCSLGGEAVRFQGAWVGDEEIRVRWPRVKVEAAPARRVVVKPPTKKEKVRRWIRDKFG